MPRCPKCAIDVNEAHRHAGTDLGQCPKCGEMVNMLPPVPQPPTVFWEPGRALAALGIVVFPVLAVLVLDAAASLVGLFGCWAALLLYRIHDRLRAIESSLKERGTG